MSTGPSSRVLRSAKRLADRPHSPVKSVDARRQTRRQGFHTAVDPSEASTMFADSRPVGIVLVRDHQSAPLDGVRPVKSEDATNQSLRMDDAVGPVKMEVVVSPVKTEDVRAVSPVSMRDYHSAQSDGVSHVKSEDATHQVGGLGREPLRPRSKVCSRSGMAPNVLYRGNLRSARYEPYDLHSRPETSSCQRKQAASAKLEIRERTPSTRKALKSLPEIPPLIPPTSIAPLMATAHPHHDTSPQPRENAVSTMPRIRPDASSERREQGTPTTVAPTPLPAVPPQLPSVSVSIEAHSSNVNLNIALTLSPGRNL